MAARCPRNPTKILSPCFVGHIVGRTGFALVCWERAAKLSRCVSRGDICFAARSDEFFASRRDVALYGAGGDWPRCSGTRPSLSRFVSSPQTRPDPTAAIVVRTRDEAWGDAFRCRSRRQRRHSHGVDVLR